MTPLPHFLAFGWGAQQSEAPPCLEALTTLLRVHAPALAVRIDRPGLRLFARPSLQVEAGPDRILVGNLIVADAAPAAPGTPRTVAAAASAVSVGVWGGFVAFLRAPDDGAWHVYRDLSGHLPVQLVTAHGVTVIGDGLPRWLLSGLGIVPSIDRAALADALAHPSLATYRALLDGVQLLPAGMVAGASGALRALQLAWRPWPPADPVIDMVAAERRLRDAVDTVLARWAARFDTVALELSGGLDSAIVLGSLARLQPRPVLRCVNFATRYPGGDERLFARAAAERAGATLIELAADEREMDFRCVLEGHQSVEPTLYGLDPILEQAMPGLAEACGAAAIMTGQGGDAVFFHSPSPLVAVDRWRAGGARAGLGAAAMAAARRAHCSVWRVGGLLLRDLILGTPRPDERYPAILLADEVAASRRRDRFVHPWLEDVETMPPAKYAHLAALANGQLFSGPTRRSAHVPLLHPLLAQPVVEAALAIPTYMLAFGPGNRALARRAFADRVPPSILGRQGKGEAGTYYGRGIVANLAYFRELLLDGVLVRLGLLDRRKIEATLRAETLLWRDHARQIAVAASFESWARDWQA